MKNLSMVAAFCAAAVLAVPSSSKAFCGFYVSGADGSLYNNATMVVMMREGTRTVLSMQNNYQGPPADFAMIVPVPVVLQEENVKTLPQEIFSRVDKLAAPRLVEYWEQDPCRPQVMMEMATVGGGPMARRSMKKSKGDADMGVTVEAEFKVAEYDIVILSAKDSGGLEKWLRMNKYNIPGGAEKVLRGYVAQGTKFFVAKVDAKKVKFKNGKTVLSPLRFHYDTPTFTLPVRLGLLNSSGEQDLIVHILAKRQRYEVANYKNVTIPTNIRVENKVRENYGAFYDALFKKTIAKNKGAVVTEYSWDATSCDPCPEPPLQPSELATLGADVLVDAAKKSGEYDDIPGVIPNKKTQRRPVIWRPRQGFVLTRLHYRYDRNALDEDLVFKTAPPIVGGRGMPDRNGEFQERRGMPQQRGINNFQGRYIILHPWEQKLECEFPQRGMWGGPPGKGEPRPLVAGNTALKGIDAGSASRMLPTLIKTDIPELGLKAKKLVAPTKPTSEVVPDPTDEDPAKPSTPSTAAKKKYADDDERRRNETGTLCSLMPVSSAMSRGAKAPLSFALLIGLTALIRRRRFG